MPHVTSKEGLLQQACLLGRLEGALVWSPWGVRGVSASSSSLSLPRGSACLHKPFRPHANQQVTVLCVTLRKLSYWHIQTIDACCALFGSSPKSWLCNVSLSIWLWIFLGTCWRRHIKTCKVWQRCLRQCTSQ